MQVLNGHYEGNVQDYSIPNCKKNFVMFLSFYNFREENTLTSKKKAIHDYQDRSLAL